MSDDTEKHCSGKPNCVEALKAIHQHFTEGNGVKNAMINFCVFIAIAASCVGYQYWYQNNIIKKKLPEANYKLLKGIIRLESQMNQKKERDSEIPDYISKYQQRKNREIENEKVFKLEDFDKTLSDQLENQRRMALGMNNGLMIESEDEEGESVDEDEEENDKDSVHSDIELGGVRQSILSGEHSQRDGSQKPPSQSSKSGSQRITRKKTLLSSQYVTEPINADAATKSKLTYQEKMEAKQQRKKRDKEEKEEIQKKKQKAFFRQGVSIMFQIDNQSAHSRIIELHRIENYKRKFALLIKSAMIKRSKNWFKRTWEIIKDKYRKTEKLYQNEHVVDKFIDDYWFVNCPDHLSTSKINDQVYRMIHELMMQNVDDENDVGNMPSQATEENLTQEDYSVGDKLKFKKSIKFTKNVQNDPCRKFELKASKYDAPTSKKVITQVNPITSSQEKEKPVQNFIPQLQVAKVLLDHAEHINAIMIAMKPGLYEYYFVKFSKEIVKEYFRNIRIKYLEEQQNKMFRRRSMFIPLNQQGSFGANLAKSGRSRNAMISKEVYIKGSESYEPSQLIQTLQSKSSEPKYTWEEGEREESSSNSSQAYRSQESGSQNESKQSNQINGVQERPQIVKVKQQLCKVDQDEAPPRVSEIQKPGQQANYIDIVSSKDEVESITVSLKSPLQIEVGGQDVEKLNSKYEKSIQISNMDKTFNDERNKITIELEKNQNDKRFESEIENSPAPDLIIHQEQDIEVEVINQQITQEEAENSLVETQNLPNYQANVGLFQTSTAFNNSSGSVSNARLQSKSQSCFRKSETGKEELQIDFYDENPKYKEEDEDDDKTSQNQVPTIDDERVHEDQPRTVGLTQSAITNSQVQVGFTQRLAQSRLSSSKQGDVIHVHKNINQIENNLGGSVQVQNLNLQRAGYLITDYDQESNTKGFFPNVDLRKSKSPNDQSRSGILSRNQIQSGIFTRQESIETPSGALRSSYQGSTIMPFGDKKKSYSMKMRIKSCVTRANRNNNLARTQPVEQLIKSSSKNTMEEIRENTTSQFFINENKRLKKMSKIKKTRNKQNLSQQIDIEMYRQIGGHGISQMIKQQTEQAQKPATNADFEPQIMNINQNFNTNTNLLSGEGVVGISKKGIKKIRQHQQKLQFEEEKL